MDKDNPQKLLSEEAELQRQLADVRNRLARIEKPPRARRAERPLRDVVLDLLADANTPLNSTLISSTVQVLYGRDVPATRFGTLSNDEQKSFSSTRSRPVYLCHCLTYDDGQAVKRFWARSDWPLHERLIGPMTGRVLFLKSAAWVIKLACDHPMPVDARRLQFLAADQARDAGLPFRRDHFPYKEWLKGIDSLLDRHLAGDDVIRKNAAAMLEARLAPKDLLFGTRGGVVSLPGSMKRWKTANE